MRRSKATNASDHRSTNSPRGVVKCPTGIRGLDEITLGGLPRGRPTLVCGGAGCGKTLFGMEFLIRGATQYDEPGVCLSFEETVEDLADNVASLGFDLHGLISRGKLAVDHVYIERSLIEETGEYDLEALFIRLGHAVNSVGAKRVLIDSVESLFAGLGNEAILRSELSRLFRWLKQRNLTAVVTGERGSGMLTRHGLEEYISDCVILLDHQINDTILTRRLRVVKYRGSTHGTNEYPFLIESNGISVLPVTSTALNQPASQETISTGVPALDSMLAGGGYYRGSSVLITGTAGTGKTSLAANWVNAGCARGERCVYFSFEESPQHIIRNMRSIGLDLKKWVDRGLLRFSATRPATFGLEMHLVKIHGIVEDWQPSLVVIDPVSALLHSGTGSQTNTMLLRMIDYLKGKGITALMTTLTSHMTSLEQTPVDVSSLVDAWILLRDIESGGERNRGLYILKARGMAHSNQIREFVFTDRGFELRDVYLGDAGLVTGSARVSKEANDASVLIATQQEIERRQFLLEQKRKSLEAKINALRLDLEIEEEESKQAIAREELKLRKSEHDQDNMAKSRTMHLDVREGGDDGAKPSARRKR